MTHLRPDCPGSEPEAPRLGWWPAEEAAVQLAGPLAAQYPEAIQAAVAAVVYFFQHDLGRSTVSVAEFGATLSQALAGLGLRLELPLQQSQLGLETDLSSLLDRSGPNGGFRLFARLREHLRQQLRTQTTTIRYCGLRRCVRRALGLRRWTARCQRLADQIVEFLRVCLWIDGRGRPCVLVVR